MEKYYALIKNNLVESIIVADDNFLLLIKDKYDYIINVTDSRPHVHDSYAPDRQVFIANNQATIELPYNKDDAHLNIGTESGFTTFELSKYPVKYDPEGYVFIGCKRYSALGLLDALHKTLVEEKDNAACFMAEDKGPGDGKFNITWDDAQKLYDVLSKVKL